VGQSVLQAYLKGRRHQRKLHRQGLRRRRYSSGLLAFIVGTAAGQANITASLGFYGAGIALYERLLRRGKEVAFPSDTRTVLQTTARHSATLKPDTVAAPALAHCSSNTQMAEAIASVICEHIHRQPILEPLRLQVKRNRGRR
jgi:hypothetical protein